MTVGGPAYTLSHSSGRCAATQRAFEDGETFIAVLHESGAALARSDYGLEAWNAGSRPAGPIVGFWKATFQARRPERGGLLADADLLNVFDDLGQSTDPRQVRFRFLLTLLLVRRRMLRVVSTRRTPEGKHLLVQRRDAAPGTQPLEVLDPGMDDTSVTEAVEQLGMVLEGEAPRAS